MKKMKPEVEWNIKIQSQTNVPASVTKDELIKAIFSIKRDKSKQRINEFNQSMIDKYPDQRPIMVSGDEVYISPWYRGQKVVYSQVEK